MLRRVRLRKDVAGGWVLRVRDRSHESTESIPPSPGDQLLHNRIKELGLSESTEQLLNGEECVVPMSRNYRWPLP
jgi:hypothetical protein